MISWREGAALIEQSSGGQIPHYPQPARLPLLPVTASGFFAHNHMHLLHGTGQ
jgi:hypothetical protein